MKKLSHMLGTHEWISLKYYNVADNSNEVALQDQGKKY